MFKKPLFSLLFLVLALSASDLQITDPYVRAVPPNMPNSAAFMEIKNLTSSSIDLIQAYSTAAKNVELHEHVMDGQMMKMQQIDKITLEAQKVTPLEPGGYHIMLLGLNQPLKEETSIVITLHFSNAQTINIDVPVKSIAAGMKMKQNHHGMQH